MHAIFKSSVALLTLFTAVASVSFASSLRWTPLPPVPDPEGFAGGFAGVSGGALLFAGGSNFPIGKRQWQGGSKQYYDTLYVLESPTGAWRIAGRLPRPNGYGVSGSYGGEFILAGGGDLEGPYDAVFALSWRKGELHRRDLPKLPRPLAFGGGAIVGHTLYVACGLEEPQFTATRAEKELWSLDLSRSTSTWQVLAPLPGPGRAYPIVGGAEGRFYVFGGVALSADAAGKPVRTYLRDAYTFGPDHGWMRLADLPHPLGGAASPTPVAPNGRLILVGGDDGTRLKLDGPNHPGFPESALAYDPARNRWAELGEIPFSRSTAPTAFWSGFWVLLGGERKPGYRTPEVWGLMFESRPERSP